MPTPASAASNSQARSSWAATLRVVVAAKVRDYRADLITSGATALRKRILEELVYPADLPYAEARELADRIVFSLVDNARRAEGVR
ncbi:hypothetical protein [Streptomyces sp. JNUCC 63]